ncbi:MAG: hypothetical protein JJ974_01305 [Phycisphaerales bacterium]|nr:hypothetical protein [Phycisphaerales bacterium]
MSDRICYLERTDRGLSLDGIRLIGAHSDDQWRSTVRGTPDAVLEMVDDAAVWIRQRLKAGGGTSKSLPILCLDTDGAVCTWTKPEDTSPEMISAAIEQLESDQDDDALEGANHSTMGERFPNLPLEVHYQPLSDEQTSEGSRRAVIATPDVPARLLIDELDSMGIRIGRVENLWTFVARAWDPGARTNTSTRGSQRVVTTDDPVCACVVLDSTRDRMVWTWSKEGELIAAGSMRVGHSAHGPTLHESDLSRLCADWIGWASQIGVSPLRIVMVTPEPNQDIDPDDDSGTQGAHQGLDRAQIARVFSTHWPTATTDLIHEADPIQKTLRVALEAEESNRSTSTSFSSLTNRPGRSHRAMYRWASLALILGGAAIGWTGWTLYSRGLETAQQAKDVRSQMVEQIMTLQPPLSPESLRIPTVELQARLNKLRTETGPMQVTPTKPILEELETISFVLGMSGIEIDSIQLTHTLAKLKIRVDEDDLSLAEQINESLRSIQGSTLQWRPQPELVKRGNKIEASFTAVWDAGSSS